MDDSRVSHSNLWSPFENRSEQLQSVVELNQSYSESSNSCWQGLYSIALAVQVAAAWPRNVRRRFLFFAKGVIMGVQRRSFLCWRRKTIEKMTVTSNDSKLQFTSNFFVK